MGRNKFEKQVKEKLQGREIKPSEGAWDRISQQLEVSKTSKPKNFQWYGIAAGFVGMIFISVLYLTVIGLPTDTDTQMTDSKKDSIPFNSIPEIIQEQNIEEKTLIVDNKVQVENSIQSISKNNTNRPKMEAVVGANDQERKVEKTTIPLHTSEELINSKIAEVVAQVEILEQKNDTVSDAEIDSLLRAAQQQILKNKIFRDDKSVDAMALLADVEDELDQSFRDQIFDVLKDGFVKVKTAVADRNK